MSSESNIFDWWSDVARVAIVDAQVIAKDSKNSTLSLEHFWIAVFKSGPGFARALLERQGADVDSLVLTLKSRVRKGRRSRRGHLNFDSGLKAIFEGGVEQAIDCGHNYITTAHFVLADAKQGGLISTLVGIDLDIDEFRASLDEAVARSLATPDPEGAK